MLEYVYMYVYIDEVGTGSTRARLTMVQEKHTRFKRVLTRTGYHCIEKPQNEKKTGVACGHFSHDDIILVKSRAQFKQLGGQQ